MKRFLPVLVAAVFLFPANRASAQIYPPADGVAIPQSFLDSIEKDRTAFRFQRAWLGKAERIRANREQYIAEKGFYHRELLSAAQRPEMSVAGTLKVPVFLAKYSNTGADPYPVSTMQTKLFTGPFSPQTLTQYYAEISYGDLNMTGTCYGWTALPQPDTYYEGVAGCNGLCGSAKTGLFLTTVLNANDAAVDFSQYDNDGPDGLPNSGDDDGFVDFAAFVHPEAGAECGGAASNNIWSHRWVISGWTGTPWTSSDAAFGGGFIKVDDYVIQPAFNCGGATPIDIGVFCHEFGHALGLPDLYDTNGGSAGVGHWGLMGSGSWNTTTRPAHMCVWSKAELGWANIVEVESKKQAYSITSIEFNRTAYRLNIAEERWRRMSACAVEGTYSMRCGLLASEATPRGWLGGDGYGDMWVEKVSRDFAYNGTGSVILKYDYRYDSEPGYDYTYVRVTVGPTVSTLRSWNGTGGPATDTIDLTPYLTGSGVTSYNVAFVFESDVAWSDRDGSYISTCGPFVFDKLSVIGGSENYSTNFETREDGWAVDMASPAEYFYVENRQPVGSDVPLWGGGGLAIWHINEDVARTGQGGNSGGAGGGLEHGVAVEQADGLNHLAINANRGDAGDPFPGSTTKTLFDNSTLPSSRGASALANNVCVSSISANPANGGAMSANMSGGWPLPTLASIVPASGDDNDIVAVTLNGTRMVKGLSVVLDDGTNQVTGTSVTWVGKDLVLASLDLNGAVPGLYDVIVTNPGGGCVVFVDAFTINATATGVQPLSPRDFALRQNYPNPFNPTTTIPFDIRDRVPASLVIYNVSGQVVRRLVDGVLEANSYSIPWDGRDDAGATVASGVYFYKLVAGTFEDVRKLVLMK